MAVATPHFAPAGIRFLQQLKKHNDRDWFNARKDAFVHDVQEPWLAIVEALNQALLDVAPDYVRPARKAAMRIYRDIRFSKSKLPYKTNMAAWWSTTTIERTSGGGFYTHVSDTDIVVGAGVYMPMPQQLLAIRQYLQIHHAELRGLLAGKPLRRLMPEFDNNPLTRVPKGFLLGDPAADLLSCRQWALRAHLPLALATTPKLVPEIAKRFRAAAALVQLLNTPLRATQRKKSLF